MLQEAFGSSTCAADDAAHSSNVRRPTVSVIVPARNEARNLPLVLSELSSEYELIVVDGHSDDGTPEVAKAIRPDAVVLHQHRRGKGDALALGFARATSDIIVMFDADGSAAATEIPAFINALEAGADFVKGSRFLPGGGSSDFTPARRLGNSILTRIVNVLFGTSYTDLCYGFNAFWREHLEAIAPDCDGFEVETLLNIRARRAGLMVSEVASYERSRVHGTSNLNIVRDGFRILGVIARERLRRADKCDLLAGNDRDLIAVAEEQFSTA